MAHHALPIPSPLERLTANLLVVGLAIVLHLPARDFLISLIKASIINAENVSCSSQFIGKKQLNQIIGGFLDKRGAPDGFGSRENQALRNVRAKREADEAGM